ncbi:YueI family protein [Lapidilactobacillus bayanensis]|uniref:YueI family protein n=1 Tax=Lapidilactobacillus bayanensis TaxID=2485998 RepID=UPI000F795FC7|nr:YueI family protein [Lapidilactobacillus bayanensis]
MANVNDVNERLTTSMTGTPETLPDQRRQFLGSLRERVLLAIPIKDLANERTFRVFETHLRDFNDQTALINGKVDHRQMGPYLQLLAKENFAFTLVNKSETPIEPDSYALLIVSRTAVNQQTINLLDLYPLITTPTSKKTNEKPAKKSFFARLFHD